jgi:diamine N-acetyltransferase
LPSPAEVVAVRHATEQDAAELAVLAERTFRATFGDSNGAEDMDLHCRKTYGREIQAREIRDAARTTLVCHVGDRLVGYGQLRWGVPPNCVKGVRPAEIQRLYVDAPWHGKGVAGALMTSLFEAARQGGADVAWLGVWERNPRAIAFYEKNGFRRVGDHSFLLGNDPQRDWVLARTL